jgi:hypothetical protein
MKWIAAVALIALFTFGDFAGWGAQSIFGSYHLDLTSLA